MLFSVMVILDYLLLVFFTKVNYAWLTISLLFLRSSKKITKPLIKSCKR